MKLKNCSGTPKQICEFSFYRFSIFALVAQNQLIHCFFFREADFKNNLFYHRVIEKGYCNFFQIFISYILPFSKPTFSPVQDADQGEFRLRKEISYDKGKLVG